MVRARSIRSVLVVDDDEALLAAWARAIAREQRTVYTAADEAAARAVAEKHRFELAIVDLRLGSDSGLDVVQHLRRAQPDALIVLCSGYLSVEAAVAGVRLGADLAVFKPVTFREILRRLDEPPAAEVDLEETPTLARAEWEHIMRVLADCNGNISMAARRLGIYRSSLQRRLRKFAPNR